MNALEHALEEATKAEQDYTSRLERVITTLRRRLQTARKELQDARDAVRGYRFSRDLEVNALHTELANVHEELDALRSTLRIQGLVP